MLSTVLLWRRCASGWLAASRCGRALRRRRWFAPRGRAADRRRCFCDNRGVTSNACSAARRRLHICRQRDSSRSSPDRFGSYTSAAAIRALRRGFRGERCSGGGRPERLSAYAIPAFRFARSHLANEGCADGVRRGVPDPGGGVGCSADHARSRAGDNGEPSTR